MNPCRCGHDRNQHWEAHLGGFCLRCPCPEHRAAETPETLTAHGTDEANA